MRVDKDLISRSALKKEIDDYAEKRQDTLLWQSDIEEIIDNAPTVSDRYDEGFRDGYAQCINDKEERKENNRLFQKGGTK